MNLMLNAIEAMTDSGGELTVTSQLHDGQLQFSVSNTGVGLPMEKIDQIFSAFFTTKAPGQRHGVGHQPFHCGIAWRPVVGGGQRWTRIQDAAAGRPSRGHAPNLEGKCGKSAAGPRGIWGVASG